MDYNEKMMTCTGCEMVREDCLRDCLLACIVVWGWIAKIVGYMGPIAVVIGYCLIASIAYTFLYISVPTHHFGFTMKLLMDTVLCAAIILLSASYHKAITTDPGQAMTERGRLHNCRSCGRSVDKMDHHCPWINSCVGRNNHRYFMMFIFYSGLVSYFFLLGNTHIIYGLLNGSITTSWSYDIVLNACFGSAVSSVTVIVFQLMLIGNDITTLELFIMLNNNDISLKSKYSNREFYDNLCRVMGDDPIHWFIPL